uniref:SAM domain-containing protein n=1 Tax=Alexandrium monilatum TaxID=311494 RepID=A0A7S4SPJ3_9DINO
MSTFSKARSVSVRKDDTKKMEEEARRMEAKLEMLRRTMDVAEPAKSCSGAERWRSGAASKPLTKGYVKGVLEAKPSGKGRAGSQQRSPSAGRSEDRSFEDAAREGGAGGISGRASPAQPPQQGRVGELLGSGQDRSTPATVSSSSRAAANLQAHMQQQSNDSLEVEAFLGSLKLDRYVSLFVEHGFDCMEVVQEMQESHMKDMGMAPGHILKLRKKLAELSPQPAAQQPPAPDAPAPGAEVTRAPAARQVSFGGTEEVRPTSGTGTAAAGGSLLDGRFSEDDSAASFQEALRAWREGRDATGPAASRASGSSAGTASSPKAAPGSFWSSLGDCEMDLVRVSTPVRAPTEPSPTETETQHGLNGGDEKLCCYQCFKQFYARYAVERESTLPDAGGNKVKKLCSEACAQKWVEVMEAKEEALRKRQEKLDKIQEMQRAFEAERPAAPDAAEADTAPGILLPARTPVAQPVA